MMEIYPFCVEWKWYWRKDGDEADCGIYSEPYPGHAYAVCRCPKYLTEDQWREIATEICNLHNAELEKSRRQYVA